jgi:hypothetical protein
MARTAVAYSTLVANSELTDPAGTSVSSGSGNGGQIASARPELTLLRISNASGSTGTATVLAGSNPPFVAAGQGNYTTSNITSGTVRWIGPFESNRFQQTDGSLIVETTQTMSITAFRIPRNT